MINVTPTPAVYYEDMDGGKHYGYWGTNPDGTQCFIPFVSPNQAETLMYEMAKADIKNGHELQRIQMEEESRMRIEDHKSELKMKQFEGMEKLKEKRLYAQLDIYEDSEGQFFLARRYSDTEIEVSPSILNTRHLTLARAIIDEVSNDIPVEIEIIRYDGCKNPILLIGDHCSKEGFAKALGRAGINVQIGKALTDKTVELLYGYLKAHAKTFTIPMHYGWNKGKDGWYFAEDPALTFEGMTDGKA